MATIVGTMGDDYLVGYDDENNNGDLILGLAGDDQLIGGSSWSFGDSLYGGDGNDWILGSDLGYGINYFAAYMDGGSGYDTLTYFLDGTYAPDPYDYDFSVGIPNFIVGFEEFHITVDLTGAHIKFGNGNDVAESYSYKRSGIGFSAKGGGGNDSLHGDEYSHFLGDDGNDYLSAGYGSYLNGGQGNDHLFTLHESELDGGAGDDRIEGSFGCTAWGGAGNDDVYLSSEDYGPSFADGGDGIDTLHFGYLGTSSISADFSTGLTIFYADWTDDQFGGWRNFERVSFSCDAGNDRINGSNLADTIKAGSGADTVVGGAGDDSVLGGAGDDWLEGQNGNDTLDGSDGNDTLTGLAGNDVILGGAGNDALYSFAGQGPDTIDGGLGSDVLTISRSNLTIPLKLNIANSNALQMLADGTNIVAIEQISYRGSTGVDNVIGGGLNDTLIGNLGNDSLYGGWGLDSLLGEVGNDLLNGGGQNDMLDGGGGNDTLDGAGGSDVMRGGTGNDSFVVDSATDTTEDTGGIDAVLTSVTFTINVNIENVTITSAASLARSATGNALANIITGSDGTNVLSGLDGNDKLYGKAGTDKLLGGNGDDTMSGGLGYDEFTGGAGNDRFMFVSDTEIGGGDTLLPSDLIRDLVQLEDRIDLSAIDAKSASPLTNEAFAFIGAAAFSAAGQLRTFTNVATNRTLIQGDVDGDKVADFQLQLAGLKAMAGVDFVL
jgi:Ca2+-binding RTX toxin-like protein